MSSPQKMPKTILYMMVCNEERTLPRTLKSVPSNIQECVFYDTGSTDNTISVINTWAADTNRKVHILTGNFIDFSTSRNYGLKYAETFCNIGDYILLLDANDELQIIGNPTIAIPDNVNAVAVYSIWKLINGDISSHPKFLLIKARKNVHYRGRVHEVLFDGDKQFESPYFLPNVQLFQDRELEQTKTEARFKADIEMLKQDYEENFMMAHAAFYIGRTYMMLGEVGNALEWLKKQVNIPDANKQELAMSYLYMGRITLARVQTGETYLIKSANKFLAKKLKKYFLKSYSINADAEPLTWLLEYYYFQKKWSSGYIYAQHACLLERPKCNASYMEHVYSCKRWCYMAIFCLNTDHFYEGTQALKHAQPTTEAQHKLVEEIRLKYVQKAFTFTTSTIKTKFINTPTPTSNQKHIILIACGLYYSKWDGRLVDAKSGVGGSELVAIKNAEYLAKNLTNYEVYFCCDCDSEITVRGVHYIPLHTYDAFIEQNLIHTLYVYRIANMIRYTNVNNVYLSLEDVTFVGTLIIDSVFRKVVLKSKWQYTHPENVRIPASCIQVIGNAIDPNRFAVSIPKNPHKFIYTSCPERGLVNLLRIFPKIKTFMPQAELHVYVDFSNPKRYSQINAAEVQQTINTTPGVHLHGRISQEELATECLSSTYWIYPTVFCETYCISAHEMMAARVLCVYHTIGALPEVIGDKGIGIPDLDDDKYIEVVRKHYAGELDVSEMLDKAYTWAHNTTWDSVNEQIKTMITGV